MYSFSATTSHQQDFTPHSAVCLLDNHSLAFRKFCISESDRTIQVSSFNYPARIDTNLYTPTSMTSSPLLPVKTDITMPREVEIKMSPTDISPSYDMFGDVDEAKYSPLYNMPMKAKPAGGGYHIATLGNGLGPESPGEYTSHPDPYYGSQFLVSAPAPPSRASPSLSPHGQPDRGQNTNNHTRYQSTSGYNNSSYKPNMQAPTLIAPNPSTLRPAIAHCPLSKSTSTQSLHTAAFAQGVQSRGKSRPKKNEPSYNDYLTVISNPELNVEINDVERLILDLRHKDGLPWKELAAVFSRKHNKPTEVAALQMRRKRMMERLWVCKTTVLIYT